MIELISLLGLVVSSYVVVRMGDLLVTPLPVVGWLARISQIGLRMTALLVMLGSAVVWWVLFAQLLSGSAPTAPLVN
jgi:hypothetical protein